MKALLKKSAKQTLVTASPETVNRRCLLVRVAWAVIGAGALALAHVEGTRPEPWGATALIFLGILAFTWVHARLEHLPTEATLELLAHGDIGDTARRDSICRLDVAFEQQKMAAMAAFVTALLAERALLPAITLFTLLVAREIWFIWPRRVSF